MTIEVGDILQYETGTEYTVQYMGDTHGIAKITKVGRYTVDPKAGVGAEMSFHNGILTSKMWSHRKALPKVDTAWFGVGPDGELEQGNSADEVASWISDYPTDFRAIVRVNPDRTWDYVNEFDAVIVP